MTASERPSLTVLAIHPNGELYGSDRTFLLAVEGIADAGSVSVRLPEPGDLANELKRRKIPVEVRPFPVLRRTLTRTVPAMVKTFAQHAAFTVTAYRRLRRSGATAVYVSTVTTPAWVLGAWIARKPVVLHVHENEPDMGFAKRALLLSPALLCRSVLCNSQSTREWVVGVLPQRLQGRVRVIYNGVSVERHPLEVRQRRDHTRPLNAASLVVVGRISERKGQDVAIRALRLINDQGIDAKLTLVGSVYPGYEGYEKRLRELIVALGLESRVQFTGFQRNISSVLFDADIVMVPSRKEPFGNVAVEAQLSEVPVIASNVEGLREVIADSLTGLSVEPDDPVALADAAVRLCGDPGLRRAIVASANVRARQRHAPDRFMAAMGDALANRVQTVERDAS